MGNEYYNADELCSTYNLFPNDLAITEIKLYGNFLGINYIEIMFAYNYGDPSVNNYSIGYRTQDMELLQSFTFNEEEMLLGFEAITKA